MDVTLLDTDTLNEVLKQRNANVIGHAAEYLAQHGQFAISSITRLRRPARSPREGRCSGVGRQPVVDGAQTGPCTQRRRSVDCRHGSAEWPHTCHRKYGSLCLGAGLDSQQLVRSMITPGRASPITSSSPGNYRLKFLVPRMQPIRNPKSPKGMPRKIRAQNAAFTVAPRPGPEDSCPKVKP